MKNTVIVLGSGASAPYGFPTGAKLIENIIKLQIDMGVDIFVDSIAKYWNSKKSTKFFQDFINGLKLYKNSQIDFYLRSRKNTYENMGKALIARELLMAESKALEFIIHSNSMPQDDWIGCFFAKIIEQCTTPRELIDITNKITIITFNYDILLEYYLDLFCKGDEEWGEALKYFKTNLKIIHIYGKLGRFDWESEENLKKIYDEEIFGRQEKRSAEIGFGLYEASKLTEGHEHAIKLSKGIEVIGGDKHLNQKLKHIEVAKESIINATKIFFFGFGFHPLNLALLGLDEVAVCGKKSLNKIFGTKDIFYNNYNDKEDYIDIVINKKDNAHPNASFNRGPNSIESNKDIIPLIKKYM